MSLIEKWYCSFHFKDVCGSESTFVNEKECLVGSRDALKESHFDAGSQPTGSTFFFFFENMKFVCLFFSEIISAFHLDSF
jgi:hypothetical protein